MKRALILCLFLTISLNAGATAGSCAATMFPPLQPLQPIQSPLQSIRDNGYSDNSGVTGLADPLVKGAPQGTYLSDSNVSYPKISEIERSLYGKLYTNQDILLRLARIEKSIFGTSYVNLSLAQRVDNIVANYNQLNDFPNISKNTLSGMESKILRRNYAQNDIENRIERLEQQIFGAVQSGDITNRFETLKAAAKNYKPNSYASDFNQNSLGQAPIMQDPLMQNSMGQNSFTNNSRGGMRGVLGGLGSMLFGGGFGGMGGTMTGFTPPIDPYNNYTTNNNGYNNNGLYNGYNNSGFNNFSNLGSPSGGGIYRGVRTNRGFSDSFSNYGSGSKVTILD